MILSCDVSIGHMFRFMVIMFSSHMNILTEVQCAPVLIPKDVARTKNYQMGTCYMKTVGKICPLTCKDGYRINTSKTGKAPCVISDSGTTASFNFSEAPACEGETFFAYSHTDSFDNMPHARQCGAFFGLIYVFLYMFFASHKSYFSIVLRLV